MPGDGSKSGFNVWVIAGTIIGLSAAGIYWGGNIDGRMDAIEADVAFIKQHGSPEAQAIKQQLSDLKEVVLEEHRLLQQHIAAMEGRKP